MSQGDWKEWSNHVLLELKRLDKGQESLHEKMDGNAARFDRYNEVLTRNTVTLEDHVARTNQLQAKVEHVEKEVDGLKEHVKGVQKIFHFLKFFGSEQGKLILKIILLLLMIASSYFFGMKEVILGWFA